MRISIIIPAYNAQNTIQRAIDSALNQDFPEKDFEIVVVNDGSTDKTLEILEKYKGKIKIISQKNKGFLKAANRGFKTAKGKYLIKLDSDDCFEPEILKEMAFIFLKKPEIDFVYCDYYEKSSEGDIKIISTENVFNTIAGGVLFKKEKLKEEGFYNEEIKFAEYDLLLKTLRIWRGYRIVKPLFYYNRRLESVTGNKKWLEVAMDELRKAHPDKIKEIQKIRKY